jgi:hypothetical protein
LREPEAGELGERPIATELAERRVPVRDEHVQQLPDEYRHGHQQTQRGDQHRPGEERHPAHVHARRPGGEDGGDERDGAGEEAGGSQRGRQREQIDEVGVAAVGPAVVEHRDDGEHCTDEPRPEAGRRESREGQRAGTHLQRHDGGGEAHHERQHHHEGEAEPLQCEQLRERAMSSHS